MSTGAAAMIRHDPIMLSDAPVIFAELLGFSCSVCAPDSMTQAQVETFANECRVPMFGNWVAVDKSQIGFLRELGAAGQPTPNPCNQVAGRRHWFLLDELNAARCGVYRR